MKNKRIICLYGGPGTGKTTTAAGVFYKLKLAGFNSELNLEYVKDWAWEGRIPAAGDQTYFFAKMSRKERILMENNLDFIVTDSPLILCHFYGMKYDSFEQKYNTSLAMLNNHHAHCVDKGYKTEHFFLNRVKAYNATGRFQDEATAIEFDGEIKQMLVNKNIKFQEVPAGEEGVEFIVKYLLEE